jgi:hypothetical protein
MAEAGTAAAKVLSKGEKIGHKARVKRTAKTQEKIDNKLLPPTIVNEQRAAEEAEGWNKKGSQFRFPVAVGNAGRWIRPDPRDTDMRIRRELIGNDSTGGTAFGMMSAGPEVIDYFKDKKEQEAYLNEMRLAEYLRDSNDPRSGEQLMELFPEFRQIPDEYFRTQLAVQEALRTILRDGKIRGRDDNALIAKIIRPDFQLPVFPAWDPNGALLSKFPEFAALTAQGRVFGIFNPRQWSIYAPSKGTGSADPKLQMKIKRMILRWVYPGLKDASDKEMESLLARISGAKVNPDNNGTSESALSLLATKESLGEKLGSDYSRGLQADLPSSNGDALKGVRDLLA